MLSPTLSDATALLKRVYGYDAFRGKQADIIRDVLAGRDTLAILPTGGGKSLCYQVPAQLLPGTGLIISPLIALMADQVDALKAAGVRAERLDSSMEPQAKHAALAAAEAGEMDLLYVSPEALASGLANRLSALQLSLIAIDEAHCVSQWGHDFRPDYRALGNIKPRFGGVPWLAVTATADARTQEDILSELNLDAPAIHIASFDRPNLILSAEPKAGNRVDRIVSLVKARRGQPGIIYAATRAGTEQLAEALSRTGVPAMAYHAGLKADIRAERQRRFLLDEDSVMCATVAFGMGVDKPDVRFVIHADPPKTLEAYWQEVGRAGRDGDPAEGIAFYGPADMRRSIAWTMESEAVDKVKHVQLSKTRQLFAFFNGETCRRAAVRTYFGEGNVSTCGVCDICQQGTASAHDATRWAQMALSAIVRTGQQVGRGRIIAHLLGSAKDDIDDAFVSLSTYGVGQDLPKSGWSTVIDALLFTGLITEAGDLNRPILAIPDKDAMLAMFRGERTLMLRSDPSLRRRQAKKRGQTSTLDTLSGDGQARFEALRTWRTELARTRGVPPYVIFDNKTLIALASDCPTTPDALRAVSGIGEKKAERHGKDVLRILAEAV